MKFLHRLSVAINLGLAVAAVTNSATVHTVPRDFASIQSAINGSTNGDTILVSAGLFTENLTWSNKTLAIIGAGMEGTFLTPSSSSSSILVVTGGGNSVLRGMTIENAGTSTYAILLQGGTTIEITGNRFRHNVLPFGVNIEVISINGASPFIHHNLFYENGGISCVGIRDGVNTKIWNNTFDRNNRGVFCIAPGHGDLRNNSISNNTSTDIGGYGVFGIFGNGGYNNVFNNGGNNYTAGAGPKTGDISTSPLYANPASHDYRLLSTSPNIDTGDPALLDADSTRSDIGYTSEQAVTIPCSGVTLHVPGGYSTIQAAINIANDCDTILVDTGVYVENLIVSGKSLVLKSVQGPSRTILSGTPAQRPVLSFQGDSRAVLDGFTVTNGKLSGIEILLAGPRIQQCVFVGNSNDAGGDGGAIRIIASSGTVIENSRFYRNSTGGYGGAIGVAGGANDTIRNNLIYANSGFSDIRTFDYTALICDNTISSNSSSAGIELRLGGNLDVRSNIVCFSTQSAGIYDDVGEPGTILAQYNGTFSNLPVNFNFAVDGTNLTVPAQFVDSAHNDYHLKPGSPYIDAGDPNPIFNDADLTRNDIGADLSLIPDSACCLPVVPIDTLVCCAAFVGNVDCDFNDVVDIADLTRLVDYLFLSFEPLCCPAEADIDPTGSTLSARVVDIADLTNLVTSMFITFAPFPGCQ